eukprot:m.8627 g.8627  ORF g.8627 m.8627 type:complete len:224 (+) comp5494_c0_seq2:128-799(+)
MDETTGVSLFDAVMQRSAVADNGFILCRISVVAELTHLFPGVSDLKRNFMELFKIQEVHEYVTGLVMLYPNYMHAVIELPSHVELGLLEWIEKQESRGWIRDATMLGSETISSREFPPFTCSLINASNKTSDYQTADPIEAVVAEVIVSSLKLARYLAEIPLVSQVVQLQFLLFFDDSLLLRVDDAEKENVDNIVHWCFPFERSDEVGECGGFLNLQLFSRQI